MLSWTGQEGVVAIPRNTNAWPCYSRTEANKMMDEKCPDGYQIVEEGEVVTGKMAISAASPETRPQMVDSTEYRIKFRPVRTTQGGDPAKPADTPPP
jgi:hypothetical protein